MANNVKQYIQNYFRSLGYNFLTTGTNHTSSSLEKSFINAMKSLQKESTDYYHLYYMKEFVLCPIGDDNLNNVSPYDFIMIYGHNIALVEIDGPHHFHHVGVTIGELTKQQKQRRLDIDRRKTEFCLDAGISLLRVAYTDAEAMYDILRLFLRKIMCTQAPVVMYSSSNIYQHLLPDRYYPRNENIFVYDECKDDDDMDICQSAIIDYSVKACHDEMVITLPQQRNWLNEVPITQNST